jgi:aspartate/glutamate racemase
VISIIEDALIQDVIRAGQVTPEIARRLVRYYLAAQDTGADLIFNTCSSIGDVAIMARSLVTIPIVKIDDAMAAEAVRTGVRVGVLATLQTTLAPTVRWSRHRPEGGSDRLGGQGWPGSHGLVAKQRRSTTR